MLKGMLNSYYAHTQAHKGLDLLSNSNNMARLEPIPQRMNWELSLGFAGVYGRWKVSATEPRPGCGIYKVGSKTSRWLFDQADSA